VQVHEPGGEVLHAPGTFSGVPVPAVVIIQFQRKLESEVLAVPQPGQVALDADEDRRQGEVGG
jgi:hypothetical protein